MLCEKGLDKHLSMCDNKIMIKINGVEK